MSDLTTRAAIKAIFQTGDPLNQAAFVDLIDSVAINTEVDAVNNSISATDFEIQSASSGGTWGPRDGAILFYLSGAHYLTGGWYGYLYDTQWNAAGATITCNQVYKTLDLGVTWTRVKDHNPANPIPAGYFGCGHAVASCNHTFSSTEYIYRIGGDFDTNTLYTSALDRASVHRSSDGVTWTRVNSVVPGWAGCSLMACVSFGGSIYLIGGQTSTLVAGAKNWVWKSTDHGATWTEILAHDGTPPSTQFEPRFTHAVVFRDKMWIVSGGAYDDTENLRTYYYDVWSSTDGVSWTKEQANLPLAKQYASLVKFGDWLYFIGGHKAANTATAIRSSDGINWYSFTLTGYRASHADGAAASSTAILIASGNGDFAGTPVNSQSPSHALTYSDSVGEGVSQIAREVSSESHYDGVILEGYTESTSPHVITPGNNNKLLQVRMPHYTGTEEPVSLIGGYSVIGSNYLFIGGGVSADENAATEIRTYIGATTTSTLGTHAGTETLVGKSFAGKLSLGTLTIPTNWTLNAVGNLFLLGGDEAAATGHARTANLAKAMLFACPTYALTGLAAFTLINGYSVSGTNYVDIGGNNGSAYAAQLIRFVASANANSGFGTEMMHIDVLSSATDTGMLLRNDGTMKRVSVGAADSGGAGFKLLRVAN